MFLDKHFMLLHLQIQLLPVVIALQLCHCCYLCSCFGLSLALTRLLVSGGAPEVDGSGYVVDGFGASVVDRVAVAGKAVVVAVASEGAAAVASNAVSTVSDSNKL